MTRIYYEEIECCYGCPNFSYSEPDWEYCEETGHPTFAYCAEAWNNAKGHSEREFKIDEPGKIPSFCPLPIKKENG